MMWHRSVTMLLCGVCAATVHARPPAPPRPAFDLAQLPGSQTASKPAASSRWQLQELSPDYETAPKPRVKWMVNRIKLRVPFSTAKLLPVEGSWN